MYRLLLVLPLLLLLVSACTDKKDPQQTSMANMPRYADAAHDYSEKSKQANSSMAPEDLAIMKKSAESLAQRLPDPGIKTGEVAPDFSLTDSRGKQVALSTECFCPVSLEPFSITSVTY